MFVIAVALAANNIGWPCQRLNWGWRNVWSTCSINAGAPLGTVEAPAALANHFRTTNVPNDKIVLNAAGVFTPSVDVVPTHLCLNAPNTGSGQAANMRNRCRRAIDAYAMLVATCAKATGTTVRGPFTPSVPGGTVSPDYFPSNGHGPHVLNVGGLVNNVKFCSLPFGTVGALPNLATPATTCPGLLGWFTVVFNACGYTNIAALAPAATPTQVKDTLPVYFLPAAGAISAHPNLFAGTAAAPNTWTSAFCTPNAGGTAASWNERGAPFRSSRCRKALDQFGRTATRCHNSFSGGGTGPAQAGGWNDPLRAFAVGAGIANQAPASPFGSNSWAPICNNV
jgi:hypothetical protein